MFCENCGAPIEAGQAFCMSCGAKVNAEPVAEAVAPVAQPVAEAVAAAPVAEAVAPVAQPVAEAVAQPVAEAVAQPVQQAQPVAAPVAQPAAEPVAAAPVASGTNGFAIAGLVLGIVTMVFCWVPILVWVLGTAGIALSIVGLVKSNIKGGKGKALTGLILSAVAAVIGIFVTVIIWGTATYVSRAQRAADSVRRHNSDYSDEIDDAIDSLLG